MCSRFPQENICSAFVVYKNKRKRKYTLWYPISIFLRNHINIIKQSSLLFRTLLYTCCLWRTWWMLCRREWYIKCWRFILFNFHNGPRFLWGREGRREGQVWTCWEYFFSGSKRCFKYYFPGVTISRDQRFFLRISSF